MRGELKKPFQRSCIGVQGQDAIRIQVISRTRVSYEVGSWIAGDPVQSVGLWIISPGHPCCTSTMKVGVTRPTRRTEFAWSGDGPEFPAHFAGCGIVSCEKAAHSAISAGSADNDFVLDDKRGTGGAVAFLDVRVSYVPKHAAGTLIQTKQVRIVGLHVDAILPESHAPILMRSSVINEAAAYRTHVLPQFPSGARVQGGQIVGGGDIHHAVLNHRRDFEPGGVVGVEDPCGSKFRNVRWVDTG